MTTTVATHGRYRFSQVARMEWIKLRSLSSTWWVLAVTVAGAVGIAVAVGVNTEDAAADLTNNALAGISLGLLLIGVLGVLMMTGECSSGMIRATLAAIPNRPLVLAAKAAVFGVVALGVGEAAGFIAFFAGGAALPDGIPAPALGQPGVLRAVVLGGAGFCLLPDRGDADQGRPGPVPVALGRARYARPVCRRHDRHRRMAARQAGRVSGTMRPWAPQVR